jgi:hypothetical protein
MMQRDSERPLWFSKISFAGGRAMAGPAAVATVLPSGSVLE